MFTRDEVMHLIVYLVVATALLLVARGRQDAITHGGRGTRATVQRLMGNLN